MAFRFFVKIAVVFPPHELFLRGQSKQPPDHARDPLPVLSFSRQLPAAFDRNGVEARASVLVRSSPFGADPPLLLEPQQSGIDGALIQLEHGFADLLDAPRDS